MSLKYFNEVNINVKDLKDPEALVKFANDLVSQLYHEATCQYKGEGNLRFTIRKKRYDTPAS